MRSFERIEINNRIDGSSAEPFTKFVEAIRESLASVMRR